MHLKEHRDQNVPSKSTCWPTVPVLIHWSTLPLVTYRCLDPRPRHMEAPQARIPASHSVAWQSKKKSSGAVTGKGGLFLNALARDQMLPVRAVEEPSRQRFFRGTQRWMELSAQLLSSPPLAAAAAAGVFSRIFFLWQKERKKDKKQNKNVLDFNSPANMYSAALLLMLAVRIYADSMEGPTGNRDIWHSALWRNALTHMGDALKLISRFSDGL